MVRCLRKLLCGLTIAAASSAVLAESSNSPAKDPFTGFYKGKVESVRPLSYPLGSDNTVVAEVVKLPDGYKVRFMSAIMKGASDLYPEMNGLIAKDGKIPVDFKLKTATMKGEFTPDSANLVGARWKGEEGKISLKKIFIESPTLGAKPPKGAVVLFDGKDTSEWSMKGGKEKINWPIIDGAMVVNYNNKDANGKKISSPIATKKKFGKFKMHLEFKTPAQYDRLGQQRGNSGVYIGGMYEIQVLDSFGFENRWDYCGSLYRQSMARVNASLPSEEWQTYDIEFTPAKFDGDKCIANPRITVYHNGVLIQKDEEFLRATDVFPANAAKFKHPNAKLGIMLQDHSNPVAYRNIWIVEE